MSSSSIQQKQKNWTSVKQIGLARRVGVFSFKDVGPSDLLNEARTLQTSHI